MEKKLTSLDMKIIEILKEDPRISINKIAQKLNVAQKTIKSHISSLESSGYMRTRAILIPSKFGYFNIADIYLWTNGKIYHDIEEFCMEHKKNVVYLSKHLTEKDISIQCAFKNLSDLNFFIDTIKGFSGVNKLEFALITDIIFDMDSWSPETKKQD
ncbi:Lrp/AsnC family transcriptional regulator [[Acholeplasma] multilocale]|uniref:Lrp/AsnC family transcriptional regulator n=1 Tax=[Acholeplasma] multilocale TaxID=264638 RepID=UPI0004787D3E|nr:Lrp/AsnC family transcriptional regulator [[Acholeplasma] multilocale]